VTEGKNIVKLIQEGDRKLLKKVQKRKKYMIQHGYLPNI